MAKRELLMTKLDNLAGKCCNIERRFAFYLKRSKRKLNRNIELKVSGQSAELCFVLGNGPSLKKVDLNKIRDYPIFTVNEFYTYERKVISKYHVCIDPVMLDESHINTLEPLLDKSSSAKLIMGSSFYPKLKEKGLLDDRMYFIDIGLVQHDKYIQCNMCDMMTGSLNVIPVVIECALSMGYKKIYLLGCDFSMYTQKPQQHFYSDKVAKRNKDSDLELFRCAFVHKQHYALERYSRENDCQIINLTEGSLIDAYEFDTLSNVLDCIR